MHKRANENFQNILLLQQSRLQSPCKFSKFILCIILLLIHSRKHTSVHGAISSYIRQSTISVRRRERATVVYTNTCSHIVPQLCRSELAYYSHSAKSEECVFAYYGMVELPMTITCMKNLRLMESKAWKGMTAVRLVCSSCWFQHHSHFFLRSTVIIN